MVVKRQQETFAPVTLGHIRGTYAPTAAATCSSTVSPGAAITARRSMATGCQTIRPCVLFAPGWSAHAAG
jgi:hypothetical protein